MSHYRYYHADPAAVAAMRRDGIGWDHDAQGLVLPKHARRERWSELWKNLKRRWAMSRLEHINITVADPRKTAAMLAELFGWHTRWEGSTTDGAGYTLHVGNDTNYIAVYSGSDPAQTIPQNALNYQIRGAMNHIGVVVDDLDKVEEKVKSMGFETHSHADYEPGRRFYFHDADDVEFEVVSYA